MKYSYQRECICTRVMNGYDHPTADMVYEDVKKILPNISLGTVYRNLNQLVDAKVIRKILSIDEVIRFDRNDPHDHMKCVVCGNILDLTDEQLSGLNQYIEEKSGNKILSHELVLTGICKNCMKKERGKEKWN